MRVKPLCHLFNLKYNSEDPTETVRQVFKKVKARVSKIINLDDVEDTKLPLKVIGGSDENPEEFMQSPYVEVCKPVRNRLLILLEVKPSIEYLNNVTKLGAGKCFSRYGSIKVSQRGGIMQSTPNKRQGDGDDVSGSERSN